MFCDFIEFLFKVFPNSLISYYISPVFSNKHEMVVTEIYRVVGSYVVMLHVPILTYGKERCWVTLHPQADAVGYCARIKTLQSKVVVFFT